jgi:hypothetical protein
MAGNEEATPSFPLNNDCLQSIFKQRTPRALGQAALVSPTWNQVSGDQSLWRPHFASSWSPENCVSTRFPKLNVWMPRGGGGLSCKELFPIGIKHIA